MDILLDINKLSEHIIKLLEQRRYTEYEKNIESIFELYEYALQKSNHPNKSNIVNSLSDNIIDIGQSVLKKGFVRKSIEIANRLMEASNSDVQHQHKQRIFKFIVEITQSVSEQNNEKSIYEIMNFLESIVEKEKYANDIINYLPIFYNALNCNEIISIQLKNNIIYVFFRRIIISLNFEKGIKRELYRRVIYLIIKYIIDRQSLFNHFIYLLDTLYRQYEENMEDDIYEIFVVVIVYLYYVSFKETYFKDEFKENAKKLLSKKHRDDTSIEYNFSLRGFMLNSNGCFWRYYRKVKDELRKGNWEYIPENKAKWLRLEGDIREFYIYYSYLFSNSYYYRMDYFENLDSNELRLLYDYFDKYNLKQEWIEGLQIFLEWVQTDKRFEINRNFSEQIINAYKQSVFEDLLAANRRVDKIKKNIKSTKEKVTKAVQNYVLTKLDNQKNLAQTKFALGGKFCYEKKIPIEYLAETVQIINFDIAKFTIIKLETDILTHLSSRFINLNLKFDDTEKIEKLLFKTESLNNMGVKINSIIKKPNNQTIIDYFENEESKEKLKNFEKKLLHIGNFSSHNKALYLDREKLKINIDIVNIDIRSVQDNDIDNILTATKIKENCYEVNITNNTKLELTYNEAKKYYKEKYKILEVTVKFEYYIAGDKVGILVSYI